MGGRNRTELLIPTTVRFKNVL